MAHESGYPKRGQRAKTNKDKNWHNPGAYADMIRKKDASGGKTGGAPIGGSASVGGGT